MSKKRFDAANDTSISDLHGATPPEHRLAMPVQSLDRHTPGQPLSRPDWTTQAARAFVIGGAAVLTALGAYHIQAVVTSQSFGVLEGLFIALYIITFGWISLAAATGIVGFVSVMAHRWRATEPDCAAITSRTALVMPVYSEDPARVAAGIEAMARGLYDRGLARHFEVFILSDTRDPAVIVEETLVFDRLRRTLQPIMPVWRRRRPYNTAKKAGNVQDFVTRWGGRYDFMVVLDADSLMAPETLRALVRRMEQDPDLGLLQTTPALAGRRTVFARLQQFCGRVYGPVVAHGLAAWQGDDGNYWGHNAIIRVQAFAETGGLPTLPGRAPFGGHILSHDFVEAALMRRAGWKVRMAPELAGSWEESPPSLLDVATRDRRWAQGNLQHAAIIGARGLAWPSRVHFATGILSYVSAPLWLALIVVGLALAFQARFAEWQYFSSRHQLFPHWPTFDTDRMVAVFLVTMLVLYLPKLLGLVATLTDGTVRRRMGGAGLVTASVVVECLLSALMAPLMMLLQTRHVVEILTGRDSGWKAQRRDDRGLSLGEAWAAHAGHVLFAAALLLAAVWMAPGMVYWLMPTLAGLLLAPLVSFMSGSAIAGQWLARRGLLQIPEEVKPSLTWRRRDAAEADYAVGGPADAPGLAGSAGLAWLIRDRDALLRYSLWLEAAPKAPRGRPDPDYVLAAAKISELQAGDDVAGWLNAAEQRAVLTDPDLLARLIGQCDTPPPLRQSA